VRSGREQERQLQHDRYHQRLLPPASVTELTHMLRDLDINAPNDNRNYKSSTHEGKSRYATKDADRSGRIQRFDEEAIQQLVGLAWFRHPAEEMVGNGTGRYEIV